MNGAVRLLNQALALDQEAQSPVGNAHLEEVVSCIDELSKSAPLGFNTMHFLRAAHELGAPWSQLSKQVFQIGWGSRSRWLMSSFTDATPTISAGLARDKLASAAMLRAGGLPVPAHAPAQNEDEAIQIAQLLGYPVVVKPANLDGGVGVATRLESPEAVHTAYAAARRYSNDVLVEKHVEGRDYRLHIVGDEVQGILERVPGGITGVGVHSVSDLLEKQNLARKTAADDRKYLKAMQLDNEAHRMLAAFGVDASFVPALGQVVRLRAAANVASGGVPVPVELAQAHPDNLELALRAARLLRLDVAGVDLLIPDIARSWLDTGGAICEINAQPQMFTTMHKPTLQRLLGGRNGRIPVLIALGVAFAEQVAKAVHAGLDSPVCTAGLVEPNAVWISARCIARGPISLLNGGRMLLRDRKVDAAVLAFAHDRAVPEGGWPVDRCDVVVLAGASAQALADRKVLGAWIEALRMLRPRCVVASADAMQALKQLGLSLPKGPEVRVSSGEPVSSLAKTSLEVLLAQEA
jgi:cyanophycin synthetase